MSRWVGAAGSAQGSREVESETRETGLDAGTGGNEGTRRGRAAAMRAVAAVHALRLCGTTEKCPFDFATGVAVLTKVGG